MAWKVKLAVVALVGLAGWLSMVVVGGLASITDTVLLSLLAT